MKAGAGKQHSIPAAVLALAYEQRNAGVQWKIVASNAGCSENMLQLAIKHAEIYGIFYLPTV
jgi:hypothetical protein